MNGLGDTTKKADDDTTKIAHYSSSNLGKAITNNVYVISSPSTNLIEQVILLDDKNAELRMIFDSMNQRMYTYTVVKDKNIISANSRTLKEYSDTYKGYEIKSTVESDKLIQVIYIGKDIKYEFHSLINGTANFHYSSILFPEVTNLPTVVKYGNVEMNLIEIVDSAREKSALLQKLSINVSEYKIIGLEELKLMVREHFGRSYEDFMREVITDTTGHK